MLRSSRAHDPRVQYPRPHGRRTSLGRRRTLGRCSCSPRAASPLGPAWRCEVDVPLPPTRLSHPHDTAPRFLRVTPHNPRIAYTVQLPHGRYHTAAHAHIAIPRAPLAAIVLSSSLHHPPVRGACSTIRILRRHPSSLSARSTRARASFRVHACTMLPDSMNPPLLPPPARYTHAGATRLFFPGMPGDSSLAKMSFPCQF
jgi:hypothetical protein